MSEVLELNQAEIRALLDLIEFHDDWNEVSEIVGVDVSALYDKVSSCVTYWFKWFPFLIPQAKWQWTNPISTLSKRTIMKIVSMMIIWLRKIMIEKNTIATDGMPNDMILNDGNWNRGPLKCSSSIRVMRLLSQIASLIQFRLLSWIASLFSHKTKQSSQTNATHRTTDERCHF